MQGALSLMIKGLRRHNDLELIVTSICRETRKIFSFKKCWANLTFFPSLVEIFVTQARSPPKRNSQCSMQSPWGVDSCFFGGWWRGTFWNLAQFFEKDKCRHFSSSQHSPCRKRWRTKGHHNFIDICAVNCCCFRQPYVQLHSFYSAAYGTIIIEFFIIIDLTCIILFALAELIQTDWD